MDWNLKILPIILIGFCLIPGSAFGEDGPLVRELEGLISESLEAPKAGGSLNIEKINQWDRQLNPKEVPIADQVEIKYLLSHWRMKTSEYLVKASRTQNGEGFQSLVVKLDKLHYALDPFAVETLVRSFSKLPENSRSNNSEALGKLLDHHGHPTALENLPMMAPRDKLPPLRQGPPIADWKLGVRIRGIQFRVGDVLLVDEGAPQDGITQSISRPRSLFSHAATVVFLERPEGLRAFVFDIAPKEGLRLIPLEEYVAPRGGKAKGASYVQVFRKGNRGERWGTNVAELVGLMLRRQMGYDYNVRPIPIGGYLVMQRDGQFCAVCSSLVDVIYKTMGEDLKIPRSKIAENALRNLRNHKVPFSSYLTPTDIILAKGLQKVATLDNGFLHNVIRELMIGAADVPGTIGNNLAERELVTHRIGFGKLGREYRKLKFIIGQLQKKGVVGRALAKMLGADLNRIPEGSKEIMASLEILLGRVGVASELIEGSLGMTGATLPELPMISCKGMYDVLRGNEAFRLSRVERNPVVRKPITESLQRSGALELFR